MCLQNLLLVLLRIQIMRCSLAHLGFDFCARTKLSAISNKALCLVSKKPQSAIFIILFKLVSKFHSSHFDAFVGKIYDITFLEHSITVFYFITFTLELLKYFIKQFDNWAKAGLSIFGYLLYKSLYQLSRHLGVHSAVV